MLLYIVKMIVIYYLLLPHIIGNQYKIIVLVRVRGSSY